MTTIDNQKTRLIDANALEEELNRWLDENPLLFEDDEFNYGEISGVKFCIEEIQKTPTIEPDSMRPHGKWEEIRNAYDELEGRIHKDCGREVKTKENYCPNCGAKMEV